MMSIRMAPTSMGKNPNDLTMARPPVPPARSAQANSRFAITSCVEIVLAMESINCGLPGDFHHCHCQMFITVIIMIIYQKADYFGAPRHGFIGGP